MRAGLNLATPLGISEEELTERAALQFFPPPTVYAKLPKKRRAEGEREENSSFIMGELMTALDSAEKSTAPDSGQVTVMALRNLPEERKEELVEKYNEYWTNGVLPPVWKISTVVLIAKPGKTLGDAPNLRPTSLTSILWKIMERMVLARITWVLGAHDRVYTLCKRG